MAEKTQTPARRKGDLTEGNVFKTLMVFSVPILLTNILNQLYNMADTIIVGQFCGADALAAVGANTFVTMLLVALFVGAGIGERVLVGSGSTARKALGKDEVAVDAAIVGIIDSVELEREKNGK